MKINRPLTEKEFNDFFTKLEDEVRKIKENHSEYFKDNENPQGIDYAQVSSQTDWTGITIFNVPLIIFGDHSCTLRYIDFPFFRGADGTQIMYFGEYLTIYIYMFLQMVITQIPGYGKYERHYKYLKEFKAVNPPSIYLKKFQQAIKPIFDKISQSRVENQHLTALRDWLLPMLMNGQVKVN